MFKYVIQQHRRGHEGVRDMEDVREIKRVLIANRGEIARRIIKTCRKMDIITVAVYADSDEESPFVSEADVAFKLDGKTSLETYLNQKKNS